MDTQPLSFEVFAHRHGCWRHSLVCFQLTVSPDWIGVQFRCSPDGPEWWLEPEDARSFGEALFDLATEAEAKKTRYLPGPRWLPRVTLSGQHFLLDERRQELRSEANPWYCFPLTPRDL